MPANRFDSSKQYYASSSLVVGYALCSSLLAVINKFAITKFNYPGSLTALQYLTSVLGVWVFGKFGLSHHDPFKFDVANEFLPAAVPIRALGGQPCPLKLPFVSLLIILGGAAGNVATDSAFNLTAYSWAFAYSATITTEMVYIKNMVMNLGLNTWGFVLYNNFLSLMMAPVIWILTREYREVFAALRANGGDWFEPVAFVAAVAATAFTVTGVVNKFVTVVINQSGTGQPPRHSTASRKTNDANDNADYEGNQGKGMPGKPASV
ncbi:GDP-mannose transporter GONST4 [Hibiscus syriacus]|uniref:GDP-mannose transporter GONST4 n=1 Tax=Hibiscus syriacus TaxID=106335 RepID=A0A6A2YHH1_HIBSY|nr:GDP-mannose transporter GONST4 [Hibiscus syriacus]